MALTGFRVWSGNAGIGLATVVAITIGGTEASAIATRAGHRVTGTFAWASIGTADAEISTRAIGKYATGTIASGPDRGMSSRARQLAPVQY